MSKEALEAASWRVLFSRQYLPGIALMAMAVWLHASNSMLTATTMPSAVAEIGGLSYISWAFALYLTGSIAAAAAVSLAVSKFGLRQTMLGATFIYTLGCVACAGAPTFPVLLAGRVVQGIGGGALVALVYVFQDRFFPNHFVPRLVAAISVVWTTAACVGPLIGGAFATWSSWRYAFWAFALQALVLMVGISVLMERDAQRDTNTAAFPVVRLSLLAATIVCVSYAGANPALPTSALFLFLSLAALVAFVARDIAAAAGSMLPRAAFTLTSPVRDG
ncbi:MAG: MFS transporter, partial [Chromatiales bacterium]|nr:MFS transporter [Chromatiales bacterium]